MTGTIPVVDAMRRYLQDVDEAYRFRIQKIDMSYNHLSGTINPVSGFLPTLRYADFSGNLFTGQVSHLALVALCIYFPHAHGATLRILVPGRLWLVWN